MGIQRAAALHPVNTTTVDTGAGIDIRLLDSAQAGANDDTQTVQWTHTQDAALRTFDPGTAGVTAAENSSALQAKGYALRLPEDMTPADDANCNAYLPAGTITFNIVCALDQSGGNYAAGNYGPNWNVALFRYNPSTNTGFYITNGVIATPTWNYTPVTGDLGTFKPITATAALASGVEFQSGEILLAQIGLSTGTVPNPTLGTATWVATLRVDNVDTNITWAAGQGIRVLCRLPFSVVMTGLAAIRKTVDKFPLAVVMVGVAGFTRRIAAHRSFQVVMIGLASLRKTVRLTPRSVVMAGVASIRKTVDKFPLSVVMTGVASLRKTVQKLPLAVVMTGAASFARRVTAHRSFLVVLTGVAGFGKRLLSHRSFVVVMTGVATLYVKIKQDILNRLSGGMQTVIKWFGIED